MKLPFDKVYMLHLAENENRLNFMVDQFKHHGISKQVEIWWTCKRDISIEIGNKLNSLHTEQYDWYQGNEESKGVYGGVFNCAFEHYTIIKQAYLRGFESILIIEDEYSLADAIAETLQKENYTTKINISQYLN